MKMEDLDPTSCFMVDDDLLDFSLEDETLEEDDEKSTVTSKDSLPYSSSSSTNPPLNLLPHPVSPQFSFFLFDFMGFFSPEML